MIDARRVARIATFLGATGGAALCAFIPVDGPLFGVLGILPFIAAFALAQYAFPLRQWAMVVTVFGGLAVGFFAPFATQASVLTDRGHRVDATVTGATSAGNRTPGRLYRLTDPAGHPVPRRLYDASGSLTVGDHVAIVTDPDDRVAPATADEVDVGWALWVLAGVGLLPIVLTSLFCRIAAGTRE